MHGKTFNFKIINPRHLKIKIIIIMILTPDSGQESRGSIRVKQKKFKTTSFWPKKNFKKKEQRVFLTQFLP